MKGLEIDDDLLDIGPVSDLKYILAKLSGVKRESLVINDERHEGIFGVIGNLIKVKDDFKLIQSGKFNNYAISRSLALRLLSGKHGANFLPTKQIQMVIDFTSFNPTGKPHFGNLMAALRGESINRCLRLLLFSVDSVYYLNDKGVQLDQLMLSLHGSGGAYPNLLQGMPNIYASDARDEVISKVFIEILRELRARRIKVNFAIPETSLSREVVELLQRLSLSKIDLIYRDGKLVCKLPSAREACLLREDGKGWTYICGDGALQILHQKSGYDTSLVLLGGDHSFHAEFLSEMIDVLFPGFLKVITLGKWSLIGLDGDEIELSKRRGVAEDQIAELVGELEAWFAISNRSQDSSLSFRCIAKLERERLLATRARLKLNYMPLKGDLNKENFLIVLRFGDTMINTVRHMDISYLYRYWIGICQCIDRSRNMHRVEYLQVRRIFFRTREILNLL